MPTTSQPGKFPPERLAMIHAIERDHFWFLGRRKLVLSLMKRFINQNPATLLDVGCGTGFNLQYWAPFSDQVIGLDRLSGNVNYQQTPGKQPQTIISDVCAMPILAGGAGVAVALDVLEHVPDEKMLAEVNRSLVADGLFFVTVPAMQWLWSGRDESAGHMRRYNKKSLRAVVEKAGFEILYLSYYQCLLFPMVVLSRKLGRSKKSVGAMEEKPGKWGNRVLHWITQFEVALSRLGVHFPFGSSLVAVMRKVQ